MKFCGISSVWAPVRAGRFPRAALALLAALCFPLAETGLSACICCLTGCARSIAGDWVFHEVKRVASPDGRFDAVILTGDAGATTSAGTIVRIVRAGVKVGSERPPDSDVVMWASDVKNLVVLWKQSGLLDLHYDEARIDLFKNHEEIQSSQTVWEVIEVRLCPTRPDFSLPERNSCCLGSGAGVESGQTDKGIFPTRRR